ncbi:MAG: dTMP kinase, partial [Deltaproteobacteria bacterium]|nr:dTMP kinase [Deltaproteobacteria bacterium]
MPSCKSFESLRNLSEPQDFLGCLFVFEGLDGSGKTTQARLLADYLAKFLPKRPLLLKEPSLGPFGLTIREKILASQSPLDPQEEMKLFLADRAWDVEHNILPALKDNRCVIIDRYILSNVAYQGARGLMDPQLIFEANLPFPQPNLTFLLELSVQVGLGRVMDRGP